MEKENNMSLCALLFLFLFLSMPGPGPASAADANSTDEAQACLSCHARRGITVTFQNNETVDGYAGCRRLVDRAGGVGPSSR